MNKTMICLYAKKNSGKTTALKRLFYEELKGEKVIVEKGNDIVGIVKLGDVTIGVSSQGDPWSNEEGIEALVKENCDIIVCAARTSGSTTEVVGSYGEDYNLFWVAPLRIESGLPITDTLYQQCQEHTAHFIMQLISQVINAKMETI